MGRTTSAFSVGISDLALALADNLSIFWSSSCDCARHLSRIATGCPAGMLGPLANTVLTSAGGIVILSSFLWTVLDLANSVSSKPSAVPEEGRVVGGTGFPIGESLAVSLVL